MRCSVYVHHKGGWCNPVSRRSHHRKRVERRIGQERFGFGGSVSSNIPTSPSQRQKLARESAQSHVVRVEPSGPVVLVYDYNWSNTCMYNFAERRATSKNNLYLVLFFNWLTWPRLWVAAANLSLTSFISEKYADWLLRKFSTRLANGSPGLTNLKLSLASRNLNYFVNIICYTEITCAIGSSKCQLLTLFEAKNDIFLYLLYCRFHPVYIAFKASLHDGT